MIKSEDPLFHYEVFRTKVTVNPNDQKYEPIKEAKDCAAKCDNELSIHCRSFNFCPKSNQCYLSDRHLGNVFFYELFNLRECLIFFFVLADGTETISENGANLVCDHYSSKNKD